MRYAALTHPTQELGIIKSTILRNCTNFRLFAVDPENSCYHAAGDCVEVRHWTEFQPFSNGVLVCHLVSAPPISVSLIRVG
jgi:hypothetical protein